MTCNSCMDSKHIYYGYESEETGRQVVRTTPCPTCQATTTITTTPSTLQYLAFEYFHEVMLDPEKSNRLHALFTEALLQCGAKITIPATEEMAEEFQEFLDGAIE